MVLLLRQHQLVIQLTKLARLLQESQLRLVRLCLIQKQTLNGRTGSWFVYNSGNVAIDVNMYSAYISGAANFTTAAASKEWDKVGSTQTVAAASTKHIPFNNVYRYVALAASTSAGTATGSTAELFAL